MPVERFFLEGPFKKEAHLKEAEFEHLKVLRAQVGDAVELVNGQGALAKAEITSLQKKEAFLKILEVKETSQSSKIFLAAPLMRSSKVELVIEKCTELGADGFYFYPASHSEKKEFSEHQKKRLHQILVSALKQSGRLWLPSLTFLPSLKSLLEHGLPLFFGDPKATSYSLKTPCIVVTGPEKGFSNEEAAFLASKAVAISLGPYTLRAETAPIAAACRCQFLGK